MIVGLLWFGWFISVVMMITYGGYLVVAAVMEKAFLLLPIGAFILATGVFMTISGAFEIFMGV